jgi:DNA-binding MarR family transcriptional regulator
MSAAATKTQIVDERKIPVIMIDPKIFTLGLTPTEFTVYVALLSFAGNETRQCWPSKEKIAGRAGISKRSVDTAIKDLETKKLIEVKDGETTRSNIYVIKDVMKRRRVQNLQGQGAKSAPIEGAKSAPELESVRTSVIEPAPQTPVPSEDREGSDRMAAAAAATHAVEGDAVSPKAEVFVFWEKNIAGLAPYVVDILEDWFKQAPDPSWVLEALQESVAAQANKKWPYAERILERCRNEAWLEKPSAAKVRKANEKSGGYHGGGESTTPTTPRIVKRPLATCPRCNGEGHFPDPKDRNSQVRCNCWHDVTIDGVAS